jgi:enhancing lycopene biosynthesis protein 2
MTTPTIGILLSGAGARDVADAREVVLLQLALAQLGVPSRAYAPDARPGDAEPAP